MGGCKCAFRNCIRATSTDMKIHFFHFPVRDRKRCEQWIINAQKPQFYALPSEKLKNKMVCQYHFEQRCFMNFKQDRLVHNAIPTIIDGVNINSMEIDIKNLLKETQTMTAPHLSISNDNNDVSLIPVHVDGDKSTFRISNSHLTTNSPERLPEKAVVVKCSVKDIIPPVLPETAVDFFAADSPEPENIVRHSLNYTMSADGDVSLVSSTKNKRTPQTACLPGSKIKLEPLDDEPDSKSATYLIRLQSDDETETSSKNDNGDMKSLTDVTINPLHGLGNDMLINNEDCMEEETSEPVLATEEYRPLQVEQKEIFMKSENRIRSRKHLLFKYISKDLNPVLSTALKMELFRKNKWTNKEKQLAMELYSTTPVGYSVLVDKWGWKFPAVETVKGWLSHSRHLPDSD